MVDSLVLVLFCLTFSTFTTGFQLIKSFKFVNSFLKMTSHEKVFTEKMILAQGVVSAGYGRGSKKLGFPTANLPHFNDELKQNSIQNGVYIGFGKIQGCSTIYPCISNIGKSPTFVGEENQVRIVETFLLNHSKDNATIPDEFYGEILRIALVGFIRCERKFNGLEELTQQINLDVDQAQNILNNMSDDDRNIIKAMDYLKTPLPSAAAASNQAEISFPSRL